MSITLQLSPVPHQFFLIMLYFIVNAWNTFLNDLIDNRHCLTTELYTFIDQCDSSSLDFRSVGDIARFAKVNVNKGNIFLRNRIIIKLAGCSFRRGSRRPTCS